MENSSTLKSAAQKELLRRAAQRELERRRAAASQTPAPTTAPEMSLADKGMDVLKGVGSGLVKGITGLAGSAGDVQKMTGDVLAFGAEKLGFSPEIQSGARSVGERMALPGMGKLPTSETLRKPIDETFGPLPEAQTFLGQTAERIGEFVPAAIGGPGSLARKAAMATVPAVTSEVAGRIPGVEGSPYQPYVEAGIGLATGLPIALGGKGKALQEMRAKAPTQDAVSNLVKEAYKKVDDAGIMFDPVSTRRAVSDIKTALTGRGLEVMADNPAAQIYRRVNLLLKGKASRSWANVDEILKDSKKVLRGNATDAVKSDVAVIVNNLEKLVKTGKITSTSGLSRDEINDTIDVARELARRNILAREIEKMKGRMPGYLGGEESAFRNQFGAYLKSPEGLSLKPAEREAFSRVVRREGPLNIANSMSSRLGTIAGGTGGMGVGALMGSTFGPIGTGIGAFLGPTVTASSQLAFRKIMERVTEKAVDDALKTILAGRAAQGKAMKAEQIEDLKRIVRAALISEAATNPVEENWFLQDANGQQYPVPEDRVQRKSGGRINSPICSEVRQVRALLSEKTASMLSMPDDAVATALHIAKGK